MRVVVVYATVGRIAVVSGQTECPRIAGQLSTCNSILLVCPGCPLCVAVVYEMNYITKY